ncbi:RNA polymerase sigma factor [Metabacillus idriensis]|uniref:RNA polymerase sigma factor n=1 Tax=Metabacillus idriensis TaxID=324768 RepID=UPI002812D3C3|nr:RNA polymerase sigma factor [Metabacillus idriensis]MDR0136737.1 RNA polymerase sigma factor [Metabacillus idriensis]
MPPAAAAASDQTSFNDIYQTYYTVIYRIALRMTKDPHLAEDIAQETFLKAFLKMDTIFEKEKLKNWLSSIARRTAIDLFLRKKRNEITIEEQLVADGREQVEDMIDYSLLKEKTKLLVSGLKSDYREIMTLKLFLEMKDQEIAEYLSLNLSTVKTKIHRARKELKAAL